ncbi:MAG: carbohydrate binding domain-containing protein [Prevotella sp.]
MKKNNLKLLFLSLLLGAGYAEGFASQVEDDSGSPMVVRFAAKSGAPARSASSTMPGILAIDGTGATASLYVESEGLEQDIRITATSGFSVSPSLIKAGSEPTEVVVTNTSSLNRNEGTLILRSGDIRTYVTLVSTGTPLAVKDLSSSPVYGGGTDDAMTFDGFAPGADGYTLEFKVKADDASKEFFPFAISSNKVGFKGYVKSESMGMYNGANTYISDEGISNPANGGTFYNTDGQYHTYRYAVTPDKRVFVYRDGLAVDTFRVADLALQPEWSVENGDMKENLIKNPGFEGEWDFSKSRNIVTRIEGWDVYPYDQYNSTQEIVAEERSNDVDQNNHVLSVDRYMWNDGWAAGEISQIVDVAPNETYTFSALAKGGIKKDGTQLGSLRIQDLQNATNKVTIPVTSDSYQTYASDFTTLANTKQVRVICYIERDKWGASISALKVDDVKLTGVDRNVAATVGFQNNGAEVAYFTYDTTGAYAPAFASLTASADSLTIDGTGSTATFTVNGVNLQNDIQVSTTSGFEVTPTVIRAGEEATVTVKLTSWLNRTDGKVILRSGDNRAYVSLMGVGTALAVKDLSSSPVYGGGTDDAKTYADFTPGADGYTLEFKVKADDASKEFFPFAISRDKVGFKGYVKSESMGMYNGANTYISDEGISNPANGGTFYNTDGQYHTYRYAVTPDKRVFVYRDGLAVDTFRVADLALQPEWSVENGDMKENLIKNPGFEGEWDFSKSRNIVTRIEGWDVYPYDQYNSTQEIVAEERSNDVDQNNHVLSVDRYMWNDGWAAGEISQIVDVAPNETYTFSALAKGGIKKDGTQLGSLRIQDLQNATNKVTIPVTSDSYQTYASDFTTLANTKQIRVICAIERDKWGASISALKVDDVKLTGVDRNVAATVGFQNNGAEVAYFTYDTTGAYAPAFASLTASADSLTIDGTGSTATFMVNGVNLQNDIQVSTTSGFEVTPTVIRAGEEATVTVKLTSWLNRTDGKVILRSGDNRAYVSLMGVGTALAVKDLSSSPVYGGGTDDAKTYADFTPGADGYTLEFKVKADDASKEFFPFAISRDKVGFKGYVKSESMGMYNGANTYISDEGISNPANGGTFYNTDGQYHTYRYAVTPDKRVFVYRDGLAVDTFRVADLALQPEWSVENGDMKENLIKNPGFEGEWDFSKSRNIVTRIEGWDVYPYDQYNSTQEIVAEERSNDVDQNNHVLSVDRYMWNDGWAAGEISQIVDVAPNETYTFSALAKGGIKKDGTQLGSLRIQDLQNATNKVTIPVTSDSYQTYASDFTTLANTKQIRVICAIERDKWGASISALKVDDVKLTGVDRNVAAKIGFQNRGAEVAYFTYDTTGAYAPAFASLTASADSLTIDGTGKSATFTIHAENLVSDIKVSATHGFAVSPTTIKADGGDQTVTVVNTTTLAENTGKVILRSGDTRTYVKLHSFGSPLEVKDISQNPVYAGGEDMKMTFDGFNPGKDGYTVEVRAKVDDASMDLAPFAVTADKVGFHSYINSTSMGMHNGKDTYISNEVISNPANGGTFYNTDGLYHTYRYAVTSDQRVFVYRDGLPVDTFRVADLALQPDWSVETGKALRNLLKNADFEGEWDFSKSRNIVTRIEGWDVYPYDQYNSTQEIVTEERSNDVDQNNHVLSVQRYKWNDGWSAGEISQIVDVAPNEIYTFSALAKGGIKSDGTKLGSLRIQDLQNADNKIVIPVSSDSYQKYSCDFETLANTKQIRVIFALERDKWGASISALKVDDVNLRGYSRNVEQQIGFENNGAAIEYFAFDNSGAFAPMLPGLTAQEITDAVENVITEEADGIRAVASGNMLTVYGASDGSRVVVYATNGTQVAAVDNYTQGMGIALPGSGIYVVAAFNGGDKKVTKVVNR